ncbi:MAG: metal-dependent hydrolase [Pseudomonadota bacterium]
MKLTWLGHGSWRLEIEDQVLLIDPWLDGNPMMADQDHAKATEGADAILVTHGHFDHTDGVAELSGKASLPITAMVELHGHLTGLGAMAGHGINFGGTVNFGSVAATLVPASHSSSISDKGYYAGEPAGFMIRGEGRTIYFSGDTGITSEMSWMGQYFAPEIGVLSAGGYYTMDMDQAAWAAKTYFKFKTVIPQHYRTFDALAQSAAPLIEGLPGVQVVEPQVMVPFDL